MESYKHSCPACGQHVEYTAGYCGRQIQCPICGGTIAFPAVPPTGGSKTVENEARKAVQQPPWNLMSVYISLKNFSHWSTVWQVAVPFLIIGTLLAGALFVKSRFADEPPAVGAPVIQAEHGGWDKLTELAHTDQRMQQYIQAIIQAHKTLATAQRNLEAAEKLYNQTQNPDEKQAVSGEVQSARHVLTQAENNLAFLRRRFDTESENYRKLGGTVDYRSRLPRN
jgi:DNA-directed RNA polymerase subunit RPC12/RpoP